MSDIKLNKAQALFKLMEIFLEKGEITPYDKDVLERLGNCSSKTLERYLKDLEELYYHIVKIEKKEKKNVWKLIKVSDILEEFINNNRYDLHNLFDLAIDFNPEIFKELEKNTLKKLATKEPIFIFKNYIMEELKEEKSKKIFLNLKRYIKNREYIDIEYFYDKYELLKKVKPIKLIFTNNNWYVAVVIDDDLRFLRISFILDVIERSNYKTFQHKDIDKYLEFLKNAQNALTLYGIKPKIATIKATPKVAKYFKQGMKKYLQSQKFVKELEDGSVIFTLEYTQELEILPLIQKWLPDLVIQEPKELREFFINKLQTAIDYYK